MLKQIWSIQLQVYLHIHSFSVNIRSWRVKRFHTYMRIMSFQLSSKKIYYYYYYYMEDTKTRSFIKRQTSGTSSDNEWQWLTTSGTTSDNEWQRVTTSGTTSNAEWYNKWQRMATSDKEWQQIAMSDSK